MAKKYIDAEKLYEHLEQVNEFYPRYEDNIVDNAVSNVIDGIKTFITSLLQEQPKIDWEKELRNWMVEMDGKYALLTTDYVDQLITDTAEHFYELGKARKEDKK